MEETEKQIKSHSTHPQNLSHSKASERTADEGSNSTPPVGIWWESAFMWKGLHGDQKQSNPPEVITAVQLYTDCLHLIVTIIVPTLQDWYFPILQ